jgi:hypothetical protein
VVAAKIRWGSEVFLLGGQLFESDGLLQVFGQHFHLHAVHDPSGWIALSLVFTGQMSSRIFDQPLMIAHTFLAHFDDPFCKPLASCHGLSVARKWTAGFLESTPGRVKCRPQNCDRLWIKGVVPKERNNRHWPSPSWQHRRARGGERHRHADSCRRSPSATGRTTLCACAGGAVGNVYYQSELFLTDRSAEGEMRRAREQVDSTRRMPRLGPAGRGS